MPSKPAMSFTLSLHDALPILALLAGLGWLLATIHPYKEPRFFATTAPFVFLLAGIGLAAIFARWRVTLAAVVCAAALDRKSTRLNYSHGYISYAVFCLKHIKD